MSATIREVVNDALSVIGEVAGAGVQAYSDDRMMADAIRTFNMLFKKYYWPQFTEWFRFQLDGTTGLPPANTFEYVRDFEDFYCVVRDKTTTAVPILTKRFNPFQITGTDLMYWSSLPVTNADYATKRLQFYSKQSTAFVNVCARVYPIKNGEEWDWNDVLDLDKDMLSNGVAYLTLSSDDLNPGAADTQKQMMEMRYRDILAALSNHPISLSGSRSAIPLEWR